jgi:O-antigen ligase
MTGSSALRAGDCNDPAPGGVPVKRKAALSLTLVGLCIFTLTIITARVPFGEAGIIVALIGLFLQKEPVRCPAWVWMFGLFVAWAFVGVPFSLQPNAAWDAAIERLKLVVISLVVVNALRSKEQIRFYLIFLIGCYALFPVRGALVNYVSGYAPSGRAVWGHIYGNPNDLAAYSLLALGGALAIAYTRSEQMFVRRVAASIAVALVVVILLTQSRGAFIGLAVGMGLATLRAVLRRSLSLPLLALAAAVVAFAVPSTAWDRLSGIGKLTSTETIAAADREGSAAQRFEIQKVAWQIVWDQPITGVGIGVYRAANAVYAPELGSRDAHNTYLSIAAELGIPGLLLWCALVYSVLAQARRSRREQREASGLEYVWIERGLVAYLVAALFGTYSVVSMPYLLLGTLWCAVNVSRLQSAAAPAGRVS